MNWVETARKMTISKTAVLLTAWYLYAGLTVALFVGALPHFWRLLHETCTVHCTPLSIPLSLPVADLLLSSGISLSLYGNYLLLLSLVHAGVAVALSVLVVWRKPDDRRVLLTAGAGIASIFLLSPVFFAVALPNDLWHFVLSWLRAVSFVVAAYALFLFPNGRFQSTWTRWLSHTFALAIGFWLLFPALPLNPVYFRSVAAEFPATIMVITMIVLVATAVLLRRYRALTKVKQQQQIKWVVWGTMMAILIMLLPFVPLLLHFGLSPDALSLWFALHPEVVAIMLYPISVTIAIISHQLWNIDTLINRTLVYGALTALITAVYVLLVGGVGSLAASQHNNLATLVVATVIVIISLPSLYRWLQTGADRIAARPMVAISQPANDDAAETDGRHGRDREFNRKNMIGFALNRTAVLRAVWFAVTLYAVTLWIVSTQKTIDAGLFTNSVSFLATVDAAIVSLVGAEFLSSAPIVWAALLQLVSFVGIGLFLFWRRHNDKKAILTSLMLIVTGIGFWPGTIILPFLQPQWHLPISLLQIIFFSSLVFFMALFPNGCFLPRWMHVLLIVWLGLAASWLFTPVLNPYRSPSFLGLLVFATWCTFGLLSQITRFKQMERIERQQMKWVLGGLTTTFACFVTLILLSALGDSWGLFTIPNVIVALLGISSILLPLTIAIATLRYRLYDFDRALNRTLVYGGLSLGIVAIYGLVVGALGALFQTQDNYLFALLATGLIAVLFQPVRERLQKGVNRLMFGERDNPYVALSQLGAQLQTTATPEAMLQSVVDTIAKTLKLPYVAIELADAQGRLDGAATGKAVAETAEIPLRYQNETVGYLVVSPRSPGESFTERERQLLTDMAGQTGAMAHSVRLTAALQRSRERLILTREEERRRIRRDLHDGLGPTLASQTFAFDAILDLLETDSEEAARLLRKLKAQNQETVSGIRQLVYALRPPALDELGLLAALQNHVIQLNRVNGRPLIDITAHPNPLPPLSAAVEVAAYRIVLEAVTNVVRHAQAERCQVQLATGAQNNSPSSLHITVQDDGVGLPLRVRAGVGLTSMRERAQGLGGTLTLETQAENGTCVTAVLPLSKL